MKLLAQWFSSYFQSRHTLPFIWILFPWALIIVPGITWSFTQADEALFVRAAFRFLGEPYFDPGWYGAPASTLINLLGFAYALYYLFQSILVDTTTPWSELAQNFTDYLLIGRFITAVAALALGFSFYLLCQKTLTRTASVFAALTLILVPANVHYAQIIRMDLFLLLFLVCNFYFCVVALRSFRIRHFILAGIFLGAAVTSKYPGVVGAVSICYVALQLRWTNQITVFRAILSVVLAAIFSVVAAVVTGPYLFINFGAVLSDLAHEARPIHHGATSSGIFTNLRFYMTDALPAITGYFVYIFGLFGLIWAFWQKDQSVNIMIVFFITFIVFISSLSLHWVRWALPLSIVIIYGLGFLIHQLLQSFGKATCFTLGAIIVSTALYESFHHTAAKLGGDDTRIQASSWIRSNVEGGALIATDVQIGQDVRRRFQVFIPKDGELVDLKKYWSVGSRHAPLFGNFAVFLEKNKDLKQVFEPVDFVILNVDNETSYRSRPDLFREEIDVYSKVRRMGEIEKRYESSDSILGPEILILRLRE